MAGMQRPGRQRRRRPQSRGQTLVEFALILPVFVLVMTGLFDASRAVYAYTTLSNAAREAARVAIVDQTDGHVREMARTHAVALNVTDGDVTIAYRDYSDTSACSSPPAVGCLATVTVHYSFVPATPVIGQLIGPVSLSATSVFPIEAACVEGGSVTCPRGN